MSILKALMEKQSQCNGYGYVSALSISFIHIIPSEYLLFALGCAIPVIIAILFIQIILTNMKTNIQDIAITLPGIFYIVGFIMFIPIIRGKNNGNFLVWYIFLSAWGTDILAYAIGKTLGKHKIKENDISPNKTIEGCISGIIGSIIITLVYTIVINKYFNFEIAYLQVICIAIILSIMGQIGDFAASSIKRYNGIKDFSNLIPGHGGMLDRFDSVIFIAPFAYLLLSIL